VSGTTLWLQYHYFLEKLDEFLIFSSLQFIAHFDFSVNVDCLSKFSCMRKSDVPVPPIDVGPPNRKLSLAEPVE